MNALTVFNWTISYLAIDIGLSYLLNYFFNLQAKFSEILVIALVFSAILVGLLSFDIPEKIINKFSRKKERVLIYITKDAKDSPEVDEMLKILKENSERTEKEEVDDIFKKSDEEVEIK